MVKAVQWKMSRQKIFVSSLHLHNNLYILKLAWCTLQSRHFMRIRSFSLSSPHSAPLYNQKTKLWLVSQSWSWEQRGLRWVRIKTRTTTLLCRAEPWLAGRCQRAPRPHQFLRLFLVRYNLLILTRFCQAQGNSNNTQLEYLRVLLGENWRELGMSPSPSDPFWR